MYRAILLGFLISLVLLAACSDPQKAQDEKNMQLVRHVHEEVAKGNLDVFDEALNDNYVRHCQAMPAEFQEIHGTAPFKAFVKDFVASVSDYTESIDLMFAKDNYVAYVTTMHCTQTGPMGPFPATNKPFSLVNIIIHRFENGKISETWISWDNMAMLQQLGLLDS